MKQRNLRRIRHAATAAAALGIPYYASQAGAQDVTNAAPLYNNTTNVNVPALLQRLDDLENKVKVLERNREVDKESADDAAAEMRKSMPVFNVSQNGIGFRSADTNFAIRLEGVIQLDSRTFFDDHGIQGTDGFLLRRARPILEGTVYRDFDFLFVPDFGTGNNGGNGGSQPTPLIFDAYLNYRYSPELQFRFGKMKPPVGLENLQSDAFLTFNERSFVGELLPNRDVGAMIHGVAFDGTVSYAAGIFNGVGDNRNSTSSAFSNDKTGDARIFFQPFITTDIKPLRGFGFGAAGTYGKPLTTAGLPNTTGGTLAGYVTDGQEQFFAYNPVPTGSTNVTANGEHWRVTPQGYYYWGPLGFLGEYAISDQRLSVTRVGGGGGTVTRRIANTAWQLTGSYVLTGENNTYSGVVPDRPFDPRLGHWGALQLAVRYEDLDIDRNAFPLFSDPNTSAKSAHAYSVGLNWWLNRNVRVLTSFTHTEFKGGGGTVGNQTAPGAVTRQPENTLFTRVQLAF